jgi:hypothetical protein
VEIVEKVQRFAHPWAASLSSVLHPTEAHANIPRQSPAAA